MGFYVHSLILGELWHQLQLKPSLTLAPLDPTRPLAGIALTLSHHSSESISPKSRLHRLGADVPSSDFKPSSGVTQFGLDEVSLVMTISRIRTNTSTSLGGQAAHFDDELEGDNGNMQDIQSEVLDGVTSRDSGLFTNDIGGKWSNDPSIDAPSMITREHAQSQTYKISPTTAWDGNASSPHLNVDGILNLIDAALRLSITKIPARALPGMFVSEVSSFKRLEDFCPAIWSPGYLSVSSHVFSRKAMTNIDSY